MAIVSPLTNDGSSKINGLPYSPAMQIASLKLYIDSEKDNAFCISAVISSESGRKDRSWFLFQYAEGIWADASHNVL